MNLVLLLLSLLMSHALAQSNPPDMVDYLSTVPAMVSGQMSLESDWKAYEEKTPIILGIKKHVVFKIKKDAKIGFKFNETSLLIQSKSALEISINGIKVNISALGYDTKTKKFSVSTRVLGGLSSPLIESRVKKFLEQKFTAKLDHAAKLLQKLRSQRKLGDAQKLLLNILGIFTTGATAPGTSPVPNINGAMSLHLEIPKNQTVMTGIARADFKQGQEVDLTMKFRKHNGRFKIDGLIMYAPAGIVFRRPNSKNPKAAMKAVIKGISLTRTSGFQMDGANSGDELLNGVASIFNLLAQASSGGRAPACDEITLIQQLLDKRMTGSVKDYIRSHRGELIASGLSAELLYALERDNTEAINYTEFFPID